MKEFYKWAFATNTPSYVGAIMVVLHMLAAFIYLILALYLESVGMFLLIPAAAIYVIFVEWKKHKDGETQ